MPDFSDVIGSSVASIIEEVFKGLDSLAMISSNLK